MDLALESHYLASLENQFFFRGQSSILHGPALFSLIFEKILRQSYPLQILLGVKNHQF